MFHFSKPIKTGTDVCRNIKTIVFTTAKSEQMKRRPTRTVSKKKKGKLPEARENGNEQVVVCFSFESNWLTK